MSSLSHLTNGDPTWGPYILTPATTNTIFFCQAANIKITDDKDPIAVLAHLISDDEDKEENGIMPQIGPLPLSIPKRNHLSKTTPLPPPPEDNVFESQGANLHELHLSPEPKGVTTSKLPAVIEDDNTSVVVDEEDHQESTPEAELLMAHHRFQHISFSKLQEMARQGILPRRLAQCKIPTCSACLCGKATKRAWQSKQERQRQRNQALKPGEIISVNQMVSPVPGLIAQMVGFLMKQHYKYATVFIDQASRMGFVYLQKTCSAEETIEAKRAFEKYAANQGVMIQAYHADNGIFKAKMWMEECHQQKQNLTFAGVNAHHQNGIAEQRIHELQETTRAMLIHASKRWLGVVSIFGHTPCEWQTKLTPQCRSCRTQINKVQTKSSITQLST